MLTASRFLDPRSDVVFKKVFGEHVELLISFLNGVMPLSSPIQHITYLPSEQAPTIPELKRPIVDVRCTDADGRIFIVEMQIEWNADRCRMLAIGCRKYTPLPRTQAYGSKCELPDIRHQASGICSVYGLALLNENCDSSPDWYHHYSLRHAQHVDKKLEGIEIVLLELQKFQPKTWEEKRLGVLWLRFLRELKDWQSIPVEFTDVPEIVKACELAQESAYNKAELAFYDKFWDSVQSERSLMEGREELGFERGKAEGLAEGILEGEAKGRTEGMAAGIQEGAHAAKLETARELRKIGLSTEQIAKATGLSIEDVRG